MPWVRPHDSTVGAVASAELVRFPPAFTPSLPQLYSRFFTRSESDSGIWRPSSISKMTCASSLSSRSMTTSLNSRPGHGRGHRPGQLSGLDEPVRGRHQVLEPQPPLTVLGPFVVPLKCRDDVLGRWRQDSVPHDSRYGYSTYALIVAPEVPHGTMPRSSRFRVPRGLSDRRCRRDTAC